MNIIMMSLNLQMTDPQHYKSLWYVKQVIAIGFVASIAPHPTELGLKDPATIVWWKYLPQRLPRRQQPPPSARHRRPGAPVYDRLRPRASTWRWAQLRERLSWSGHHRVMCPPDKARPYAPRATHGRSELDPKARRGTRSARYPVSPTPGEP